MKNPRKTPLLRHRGSHTAKTPRRDPSPGNLPTGLLTGRRRFLAGIGGVALGLPFLESMAPRKAGAAGTDATRFSVYVRQANGVAQAGGGDPEQFWPVAPGPLDSAGLAAQSDRAVSELADYASQLTMVKGLRFAFPGNGCGHSGGGNQCLTAAKVSDLPAGNESLSMGESVDNRAAAELNAVGVEPLTLYAGKMNGYIDEVLSYRGSMDLRAANPNPWSVYTNIVGLSALDVELAEQIQARRMSVNDLVRDQMQTLMGSSQLSQADRERLELHFDAIRDLELELTCELPGEAEVGEYMAYADNYSDNDNMETVCRLQMNLIALAFACNYTCTATLQIGDGNDGTEWWVGGVKQPNYHMISHRIYSHGSEGDPIPDAVAKHHQIDRIHARLFRHLLDRLSMYGTEKGTLLDDSVAVWTNDLGHGVSHTYNNVPFVMAGSCGGFLKTGQYVELPELTTHNKLFNTLLTAQGVRKPGGEWIDDFGDPELAPGLIDEIIA
ncbi:hypothetical protein DB30_03166 [Enhygromyxa salina]|uniref:Tat (Twin-arginine translocation) pathway signal sequence domain protein n=1 Tax=Enhygromyxa salina TaxID=215803 RepID=A0A0C2D733_9BACT|nr:DUF1552 domain-containing protein [Enhygromyxa salina]KIG17465.1 hypothetical protein DB30_03166 [Enhygromyxa salina]